MTTPREKFEAWAISTGEFCRLEIIRDDADGGYLNLHVHYLYRGYLTGRESMRDEVMPIIFGKCESDNVAQRTVKEIKEIEL